MASQGDSLYSSRILLPAEEIRPPAQPEAPAPAASWVMLLTAAAYALAAALTLNLAGPVGYASPLFPAAGLALAAALVFGKPALVGVLVGALLTQFGWAALRLEAPSAVLVPAIIACGATLQAALGAWLIRRFVPAPLSLTDPRHILVAGTLGALLSTLCSATVAGLALGLLNGTPWSELAHTWAVWWLGDATGVLIAAPAALAFIGRPRADWRPRRRTVALPLLLAMLFLSIGSWALTRLDIRRVQASFDGEAQRWVARIQSSLAEPLQAQRILHASTAALANTLQQDSLLPVLASSLPAASVRVLGVATLGADGSATVRSAEPAAAQAQAQALLDAAPTRQAIALARNTGKAAAALVPGTAPTVTVVQALPDAATMTYVAFSPQDLLGTAAANAAPVQGCLWLNDLSTQPKRVAGTSGCKSQADAPGAAVPKANAAMLAHTHQLQVADQTLVLHLQAPWQGWEQNTSAADWLLPWSGMVATSLLGVLLLVVTGQSRRTELAVQAGTADIKREMAGREQAQTALASSEARLRNILDSVPLGVLYMDPDGVILDCNPGLCAMVGKTADQLRGLTPVDLFHESAGPTLFSMRRALLQGAHSVSEPNALRMDVPGAAPSSVRTVSSAMRGANGRVEYFVAVLEDVTDKLRLQASESALARAESVSLAKSEFVSRMSHELRTPLNAMLGFAQLLGLDRKPNIAPHQHEWVQQIQRAGWHLLALINETLDLARIESGAVQLKLEPVQLGPLITACQALVQTAADKRRLELRVQLDDKAHAVLADTTRLKQVLTNLLSNAVKYNRDRGSVQITTRLLPGKHGTAMVDISVTDTGLGMTPEQLANLFQPYNRLGRENSEIDGTGIGLVISRRLAELMGGALEASGEPGRGATFSLRLPMHSDSASVPELNSDPTTHALPPLYQQRRVHYVEDNLTNVEVMRGVLLQRSQIVLETSTLGLDGLLSIRHQRPDLILLDMQLPDISGLELLRHLKQDDAVADVPVIVVSADATPQRMEQALTLGALHYVTKPLDIAHFLSLVDDALMASQTRL